MKKDYIWIGLICLIMGIVLAQQGKIIQKDFLEGMTLREKSSKLALEFQKVQDEKKELLKQIESLEKKLYEIEIADSKESAVIQNLADDLTKYKLFAGFSDVVGTGIIVTIDNPPSDMNYSHDINFVYDYEMLLSLINELNSAGAEAIEINGQRIIGNSEIRTAGSFININMIPQKVPFTIKAIGNSDTLDGAINQRFGIISRLREKNYLVETKKSNNIQITKYSGVFNFKYAHELE